MTDDISFPPHSREPTPEEAVFIFMVGRAFLGLVHASAQLGHTQIKMTASDYCLPHLRKAPAPVQLVALAAAGCPAEKLVAIGKSDTLEAFFGAESPWYPGRG